MKPIANAKYLIGLALIALTTMSVAAPSGWISSSLLNRLPGPTQSGFAQVNGISMYYAVYGAGEPILFIHGGLSSSEVWAKQIADLSPRYKIIVADTRGHGQSTRTPGQYSYDIFAADYLALLDYLKIEKAAIVGWSDGGIIGLDIAMKHPERVSKLFAHAANADLTGLKPDIGDVLPQTPVLIRSALTTSYDEFAAEIRELWNREPSWTRAELASIKVPTTIVLGDRDEAITMEHTKYLAGTIPGAQLVILKNAGHAAMLQSPREYSRAVARFMAPSRSLAPWARKNQSKEITTMRTSYQRP